MGGFCRRCGDIIPSDARCKKCGGTSVASKVSKALFEPAGGDRWLKTYAGGKTFDPHAPSGSPVETVRKTAPASIRTEEPPVSRTEAKASPSKRLERGKSVKASAQAHVRSVTSSIPDNVDLSPAEEAVLSNVFGSCLDPNESRGRCGMCREIFRRDMKIYPDPRRDDGGGFENIFYCRPCYSRSFARGKCGACNKDVVGDEHFISLGKGGSRGVWHKPCFRCRHCNSDISAAPSVGFLGEPCCEACFDRGGRGPDVEEAPPAIDIPDLRTGPRRITKSQDSVAMKPAVEELRKRLRSAGLDDEIRPLAKKAASTPPASVVAAQKRPEPTAPLSIKKTVPAASSPRPPLGQRSLTAHPAATPPRALEPTANPLCTGCKLPLFRSKALGGGSVGDIITLPQTSISYHADCFRCDGCHGAFERGRYVDVDGKRMCDGCVRRHDEEEREALARRRRELLEGRSTPTSVAWKPSEASTAAPAPTRSTLRPSFPPPAPAPATPVATKTASRPPMSPRIASSPFLAGAAVLSGRRDGTKPSTPFLANLGGQACCPGCGRNGTLNETKPGPGGERWHLNCLRCFGCRKRLDSGAKKAADGELGCRDCLDRFKVSSVPGSPVFSNSTRLAGIV